MTTIPLNKLTPAKGNVRKTGGNDGIEELAASIAAHGLLTSLAVRKASRGKHAIIAGHRRYRALSILAERGQIPDDYPVLCQIASNTADATEIGLAENVVRIAMHPADQFEAFRTLIDKGADIPGIAARFGVPEATVTKRLKLGRVAPAILDAYRAGELGLEQVQAFAVSDDRKAQQRVWASLTGRRATPASIREALTEGEIPSTDPRLCFIGLDAYEAAGGPVRRDLFDDQNSGYAQDAALLDQLVADKLASVADGFRAEGWGWVEVRPYFDYDEVRGFRRCQPEDITLPEAEAAERDRLQDEHDALLEAQYDEDGEDDAAVTERLETLGNRLSELAAMAQAWTPEQKAQTGVFLFLRGDGTTEAYRGLMRPEDMPQAGEADGPEAEAPSPTPVLPATLVADLTARRTAALRATLAQSPDVALVAVTHALARSAFYDHGGESCLQVTLTTRYLRGIDDSTGASAFDAARSLWREQLPDNADDLWNWCIRQTQEVLLALMAISAAHAVDAVREKGMREDADRLLHADALTKTLGFDMHDWFTPTAANYFGRVSRSFIAEALVEAGRPARTRTWSKMKKADLAALAERELTGTGWLPQPLRKMADIVQPDAEHHDMPVAAAA